MLSGRAAHANGAFPASVAVLLPGDRPNTIALATNFGLILSEHGGATWQWTCESAETAMGVLYTVGAGWRSTDRGRTFRDWTLSPHPRLLALAERGGTLYLAGTNYTDGWALATSTDEGATIQPLSTYDRVSAIKTCAANACRENCGYQADLQIWPRQVCFVARSDGSPDGKPDADSWGRGCAIGSSSAPFSKYDQAFADANG